jgi:arylsulfatase A-like enzyme
MRVSTSIALLLLGGCAPSVRGPSVLLLTLDTTNPEALGAYGGPAGLTPHLDRLAREGLVFEQARAVAPLTLPAHASLLTGLYPPRHGLRRNGELALAPDAHTLAERARERGYATGAFVAAVVLAPEFGLTQGFEAYDAPAVPAKLEEHLAASRSAAEIATSALAWLAQRDGEQPFFLWLHFYDPHFPYRPPAAAGARAGGNDYLGEVSAMDEAIGRVLDALAQSGELERTLVAAVADHGEGLGRHGEETHGAFVFDSTLRIPFLLRLPGAERAGERRADPVSQVDLAPTLCAALGWAGDADFDGRDLLGTDASAGVYFESYFGVQSFGWSQAAGWTDGRAKYVHSSAPELYELARDPREEDDALARAPAQAEELRARMQALCARARLAGAELAGGKEDVQREIERLGYAGVGSEGDGDPEPLDTPARPSPHRMRAAFADYMEGRKLLEEQGASVEACARLENAVRANPENHKAWFALARARADLGHFEESAAAYREVVRRPAAERIPAQLNLAVCLHNLGRTDEALEELARALHDTDGPPGALELWLSLLEGAGQSSKAEAVRKRVRARRPGS